MSSTGTMDATGVPESIPSSLQRNGPELILAEYGSDSAMDRGQRLCRAMGQSRAGKLRMVAMRKISQRVASAGIAALVTLGLVGCSPTLELYVARVGDDLRVLYCSDRAINEVAVKTGESLTQSDTIWSADGPPVSAPQTFGVGELPAKWTLSASAVESEKWLMVAVSGPNGASGYARFDSSEVGEEWTSQDGDHFTGGCADTR